MSKWGWATRIGGYAAAPWTGGASIPAANMAASAIERKQASNDQPGGKDGDAIDANMTKALTAHSQRAGAKANELSAMSDEALMPVLQYFKQLMSGDAGAVATATAPERGRVIDQYDAARRATATFAPRGGGQGAAIAGSYQQQAQQLGDITANAKRGAVEGLAQLAPQLQALGLTAAQVESADLNSIINAVLAKQGLDVTKRGQTFQMYGQIGEGAGSLIGQYLGRDSGGGDGDGGGGFGDWWSKIPGVGGGNTGVAMS